MKAHRMLPVICVMLSLIACAGGGGEVEQLHEGIDPPRFLLIVPGKEPVEGKYWASCWAGWCDDSSADDDELEFATYTHIPDNVITVQRDGIAPDTMGLTLIYRRFYKYALSTTFEAPGDSVEWIPDVPPGNYILQVGANWEAGEDISYNYAVSLPGVPGSNIQGPSEEDAGRPPDLIITHPDGHEHIAMLYSYCWNDTYFDVSVCEHEDWRPPMESWLTYPKGHKRAEIRFAGLPASGLKTYLSELNDHEDPTAMSAVILKANMTVGSDGLASWAPVGVPPGRYLWLIHANWNDSDSVAHYSFVLDIE